MVEVDLMRTWSEDVDLDSPVRMVMSATMCKY